MANRDTNRSRIEAKVAAAKHMSKSEAENAVVFYDTTGRWVFEVYLPDKNEWQIEHGSKKWASD